MAFAPFQLSLGSPCAWGALGSPLLCWASSTPALGSVLLCGCLLCCIFNLCISLTFYSQTTLQGTSAFHYALEQALACCLAAPGTQSPHGPGARCWLPHTAGTPRHPSKCHQAQKRPVHPDSPRRSTIFNGNKSPGWDLLPAAVPCEVKQKKENKNDRGRRAQAPSLAPQRESSHQD